MNRFDEIFFSKYVPEGEMIEIIHRHIIVIIGKIIVTYFFGAILPSFLYYYSDSIKSIIPFFVLEIFIIGIFIKGIYDIFNWYNDVWILTDEGIVDLEWSLWTADSVSIKYEAVEGMQIIETGFIDTILKKGDIIINKIGGGGQFLLEGASYPYESVELIDQMCNEVKKKKKPQHKDFGEQNFETVLKALTQVVEGYLEGNGYKKDDSEEKKALIKEVKKKGGAIDLTK